MSTGMAARRAAMGLLVLGAGCHAGLERGAPGAGPSGGFAITERAETGPITALGVRPPFLWAAGAPGLRRWNLGSGEVEAVGHAGETGGTGIVALAIDDDGGAWIAGPKEIGRWLEVDDELRYEPKGSPGPVTALAARRPVRSEGVWVGGPDGLFLFDGRAFAPVDGLRGVAVTSLTLDADGRAVWVGTRGGGMFRADGDGAKPATGSERVGLDDVVGVAVTATGTRVVAGNAAGEARLYALTLAGAEGYRAPAGNRVVALVERGGDALLVAGPPGQEQAYTLRPLAPGELPPAGSLRFSSLVPERGGRWAGVPTGLRLPPAVTVAAAADGELYAGSARMGVARAAPEGPVPLPGAELVGDAARLGVACVARARCFVVTSGPRAWQTDGDRYRPVHVGEPAGAAVLALATDGRGTVYAISTDGQTRGLAITKHSGVDADGGDQWQPLYRIALELPPKMTVRASFAALSPAGALWVGLRAVNEDGEEIGDGAVEIDLSNGHAVEHRSTRPSEHASPEALPLPANLTGMFFDSGSTWYAAIGGISRFQDGQLRSWSENDGLASELVHGIGRGIGGALWAATSEGLVRWDGKDWRALGTAALAIRGLATDGKGRVWLATSKGLRAIAPPPGRASAGDAHAGGVDPGDAPVVLAGDMRDVVVDRFGRVWAMSVASIALVDER